MAYDFTVETLGKAKILSPIKMSENVNDGFANYVGDDDRVLVSIDTTIEDGRRVPRKDDTAELAGPRKYIYFNPAQHYYRSKAYSQSILAYKKALE
ncbi:MAG: hypothetical protein HUK24_03445, partial [Sphaerochaetaceae bacterium]|nr:hypothetical protein [Sphaerochaetaceae bacterium]